MTYNFDQVPDRRATESVKWHFFDSDVLPMWVADMDFVSPPEVIREMRARVEHGVFGYPMEQPELLQTVVDWVADQYGWAVQPHDLIPVPGVVVGFNLVTQALTHPGEGVLIQTPVYPPFFGAAKYAGLLRQEAELALQPDGSYEIDFDAFEAAITDQTRLFILCNPHNPVGRVFRRDELERLAEICLRHDILICSDEIHCDLLLDGRRHTPIASLSPEIARSTITLIAPSKTFNIAGLECSFAIIQNPELREKFQAGRRGLVGGVNLMGLVAARAAYQYGRPWLTELRQYLQANRDLLVETVRRDLPGVKMGVPEATYLAWLDCRGLPIEGKACEFFEKTARVGLNDGATFGAPGEGFVRLNFGCPRSMLEDGLARMRRAVAGLKG